MAKKENCSFYQSPAEAELMGYRPCLRCRPELAPGYSEFSQRNILMEDLLSFMEAHNYQPGLIGLSEKEFGITSRHINRLFKDFLGVSPSRYMMTKRLLKAKFLLTDTHLPIGEIAYMIGFGSRGRFNAAIKEQYKLSPSAIRKTGGKIKDYLSVKLFYRPPYNWQQMMAFFRFRAIPHVEIVDDNLTYIRSLLVTGFDKDKKACVYKGWIKMQPVEKESYVDLSVSKSLEPVLYQVVTIVRKALDLDIDPSRLKAVGLPEDLRLPGSFDPFEVSVRGILGQQVTVKAATTLAGRLAKALGQSMESPFEGLDRYFFGFDKVLELGESIYDKLGSLGIIRSRTGTIKELANKIAKGQLAFNHVTDIERFQENLMDIKGIGDWSAQYLTLRALSWPDAFPVTDLVIKQNIIGILVDEDGLPLTDKAELLSKYKLDKVYQQAALKYAEQYRPWRSYLALAIWNQLYSDYYGSRKRGG